MAEKTEKTRYSDEELEEFRVLLQGKLDEAKEQLGYYLKSMKERSENPDAKVKGLDDGSGTAETERINELAGRTKKHIQHLENALIRVKNKVYGVCRETGKLISKERLKVVPHATLSIHAKEARKKS